MPKPLERRQRNRESDARRKQDNPWRAWYGTARWQSLRAAQLQREPLCRRCKDKGLIVPATVAHHVERHQGDPFKFWEGELASSCQPCHDIDEQRIERGGRARQDVGADGWPLT
jgi:5-methylcytosine-specific restriction protein A